MTVATKTNERPGTRARVRYVRMSASKARIVLDLIRGKHVIEANEILAFSDRLASEVIGKCLRSAVANAVNNDEIPAEELYVSACYADEGPTLKRYRPRARGRAGRIHKQTCHITIVVSRYTEDEIDERRQRAELKEQTTGRSGSTSRDAAAARARRVARSRQADEVDEAEVSEPDDAQDTPASDDVEDNLEAAEVVEDTVTEEAVGDTVEEAADDATSRDEADGASDEAADGASDEAADGASDESAETEEDK
jgi:large subunit ribosomal protein L22